MKGVTVGGGVSFPICAHWGGWHWEPGLVMGTFLSPLGNPLENGGKKNSKKKKFKFHAGFSFFSVVLSKNIQVVCVLLASLTHTFFSCHCNMTVAFLHCFEVV